MGWNLKLRVVKCRSPKYDKKIWWWLDLIRGAIKNIFPRDLLVFWSRIPVCATLIWNTVGKYTSLSFPTDAIDFACRKRYMRNFYVVDEYERFLIAPTTPRCPDVSRTMWVTAIVQRTLLHLSSIVKWSFEQRPAPKCPRLPLSSAVNPSHQPITLGCLPHDRFGCEM